MIAISSAVKYDAGDPAAERLLSDCRADEAGSLGLASSGGLPPNVLVLRGGGREGHAARIINNLRIDMVQAAENA